MAGTLEVAKAGGSASLGPGGLGTGARSSSPWSEEALVLPFEGNEASNGDDPSSDPAAMFVWLTQLRSLVPGRSTNGSRTDSSNTDGIIQRKPKGLKTSDAEGLPKDTESEEQTRTACLQAITVTLVNNLGRSKAFWMLPGSSIGKVLKEFRPSQTPPEVRTLASVRGVALPADALLRDVWMIHGSLRRNEGGDLVRMLELHIFPRETPGD